MLQQVGQTEGPRATREALFRCERAEVRRSVDEADAPFEHLEHATEISAPLEDQAGCGDEGR